MPIIAALFIALLTIGGIKYARAENQPWAYPLTLALYPLFYLGFAYYAKDFAALKNELLFALPIFLICLISARKNIRYSAFLLAAGYIGHGVYDIAHPLLFSNPGTPLWWPEFCGTIDVIIGAYLIALAKRLPQHAISATNA